MDAGRFRRCRSQFVAWILTPVVLMLVCYHGVSAYCRYVETALGEQADLTRMLPLMEQSLAQATATMRDLTQGEDLPLDLSECVVMHLNEAADASKVDIMSLRHVEEKRPTRTKGLEKVGIAVKQEGTLSQVVHCLHHLRQNEPMVTPSSVVLRLSTLRPFPQYTGELILEFQRPFRDGSGLRLPDDTPRKTP